MDNITTEDIKEYLKWLEILIFGDKNEIDALFEDCIFNDVVKWKTIDFGTRNDCAKKFLIKKIKLNT